MGVNSVKMTHEGSCQLRHLINNTCISSSDLDQCRRNDKTIAKHKEIRKSMFLFSLCCVTNITRLVKCDLSECDIYFIACYVKPLILSYPKHETRMCWKAMLSISIINAEYTFKNNCVACFSIFNNLRWVFCVLYIVDRGVVVACSPFYLHGLALIPGWISNHRHYKVWDEFIYRFLNFDGATIEV